MCQFACSLSSQPAQWGEEERTKAKKGFKLDLPATPSPSKGDAGVTKPPRRKHQHKPGIYFSFDIILFLFTYADILMLSSSGFLHFVLQNILQIKNSGINHAKLFMPSFSNCTAFLKIASFISKQQQTRLK
jgi:hypothetical protein